VASQDRGLSARELAHHAVELTLKAGAQQAAAAATRSRHVSVDWRDGKLENVSEAIQRKLALDVYVDGRYASATTSDLRPDALARFVGDTISLTRALAVDPDRRLPDPELYRGRPTDALELDDPAQARVTSDERKRFAAALEGAARRTPGADAIVSVSSSFADGWNELEQVTSNGFEGTQRSTWFNASCGVSIKDGDRRPEGYAYAVARFRGDLRGAEELGRDAAERTLARRGAAKARSAVQAVVVENRSAGRLLSMLFGPLRAESLQQKRSFLEGKLGQRLGSKVLHLVDQPLVRRGLGSRHFDGEGLAARARPIFEDGVLRSYYVDTYYGRKLGIAPNSGTPSNLEWRLGERGLAELVAAAGKGLLVTSFLGGNSNGTTGDFSLGVQGFRIARGRIAEPVAEMNVSGNHADLWQRLVAVGNDPFLSSPMRAPSLAFDGLQVAGT
jgi:PmbA protein